MSDTVYIVECGSYSDTHTLAAYTSQEEAEKVCDEWNKTCDNWYRAYITAIPLNTWKPSVRNYEWMVTREEDGSLDAEFRPFLGTEPDLSSGRFTVSQYGEGLMANVFANSRDEAIKIASDKFREYLYNRSIGVVQ